MMAAMIGGQRNPKVLAQLVRSRMRTKIAALEEAFVGNFTDHHAFLLTRMRARIDAISADITGLDARIEAQIAPFADAVERLDDIPGVGVTAARVKSNSPSLHQTQCGSEHLKPALVRGPFASLRPHPIARPDRCTQPPVCPAQASLAYPEGSTRQSRKTKSY